MYVLHQQMHVHVTHLVLFHSSICQTDTHQKQTLKLKFLYFECCNVGLWFLILRNVKYWMSIISFFFSFFVVVAEYNYNIFLSIALCFYTALYFFSVLYCNHVFLMAKSKQKIHWKKQEYRKEALTVKLDQTLNSKAFEKELEIRFGKFSKVSYPALVLKHVATNKDSDGMNSCCCMIC